MQAGEVKLTMPDGSTRSIFTAGARELRLSDRAFEKVRATIQGVCVEPARRLDRELSWLREAVRPDGKFF